MLHVTKFELFDTPEGGVFAYLPFSDSTGALTTFRAETDDEAIRLLRAEHLGERIVCDVGLGAAALLLGLDVQPLRPEDQRYVAMLALRAEPIWCATVEDEVAPTALDHFLRVSASFLESKQQIHEGPLSLRLEGAASSYDAADVIVDHALRPVGLVLRDTLEGAKRLFTFAPNGLLASARTQLSVVFDNEPHFERDLLRAAYGLERAPIVVVEHRGRPLLARTLELVTVTAALAAAAGLGDQETFSATAEADGLHVVAELRTG